MQRTVPPQILRFRFFTAPSFSYCPGKLVGFGERIKKRLAFPQPVPAGLPALRPSWAEGGGGSPVQESGLRKRGRNFPLSAIQGEDVCQDGSAAICIQRSFYARFWGEIRALLPVEGRKRRVERAEERVGCQERGGMLQFGHAAAALPPRRKAPFRPKKRRHSGHGTLAFLRKARAFLKGRPHGAEDC